MTFVFPDTKALVDSTLNLRKRSRLGIGPPGALLRLVVGTAALVGMANRTVAAQAASNTHNKVVLDGIVTDSSLAPIEGATISVHAANLQVRTGSNGRFRIDGVSDGQHTLSVRRLGYEAFMTSITVTTPDTLRLAITLRPVSRELETVMINETTIAPSLAEFQERLARGVGQYMTEADIRRLNFVTLSGFLATFQSVAVGKMAYNTRGFGFRACPFRVFVDGAPIVVHDLDTDLPAPGQLAGIEVYANSATVPIQYATFGGNMPGDASGAVCGVILLWMKR
jgi:hypothetical protein